MCFIGFTINLGFCDKSVIAGLRPALFEAHDEGSSAQEAVQKALGQGVLVHPVGGASFTDRRKFRNFLRIAQSVWFDAYPFQSLTLVWAGNDLGRCEPTALLAAVQALVEFASKWDVELRLVDVVGSRYLLWKKEVIIGCQVATTTIVLQRKSQTNPALRQKFLFRNWSRAQTGRVKTLELDKAGFFQLRTLTERILCQMQDMTPKRAKSRHNGHRRATTMPALGIRTPRIGTIRQTNMWDLCPGPSRTTPANPNIFSEYQNLSNCNQTTTWHLVSFGVPGSLRFFFV